MSDTHAAEKIASEGGPPETSPAFNGTTTQSAAEQIASSEGGAPAPAAADRAAPTSDASKMENKLEAAKESKTPAKKDTDVAGRKEKGALGGGFLRKLMPWKKDKKAGETKA